MQHSETHPGSDVALPGRFQSWGDSLARRVGGPWRTTSTNPPSMVGRSALAFTVTDFDGTGVTLASLLDSVKPLLLVFINPTCTSCHEALGDIGKWQHAYADRLQIAVISTGTADANRPLAMEHGLQRLYIQRNRELIKQYGLAMAPAAVVVQTDGRIATEPQYGQAAIRQMVTETLGVDVAPAPPEIRPVRRGDPAPRIDGVDLDGKPVSVDDYLGAPYLLVFWAPECGYCEQLLPRLRAFEHATTRVPLIVVSKGSVTANQALRLSSPIMIDDKRTIAEAYGISGTPAALLIGAKGLVASDVANGAQAVGAYIDRCHVPVITPAEHRAEA